MYEDELGYGALRNRMKDNQEIVVHLVHGTFDARKPGVPHWSEPDGMLAEGVKARLPDDIRSRVKFEPFYWSGKNSFEARKQAADALTDILNRADDKLRFFIGHSHGGTIIADALVAARQPDAVGVMTLATPFVARVLDVSQGRLGMALYAPVLAFWVAFSGALACAIYQAWTGAGLCLAAAVIAPLGFASGRVGHWAGIFGSVTIVILPVAFMFAAFWDSDPLSTLPATLLVVFFLVIYTAPRWTEWTSARLSTLRDIPAETELPAAPAVGLTALRLPGDEASFAIVAAQAMVWFETKNVLGTVTRLLRRFYAMSGKRAVLTWLVLWAGGSGVAALTSQPYAWWVVPFAGLWWMVITVLLILLVVTVFLLWLRVLTTGLLALATGVEVLYGNGAVNVYAEPLPRWRSQAHCHLEILGWTADDAKQMPPLRHSMHRLGFVHQRVADWMVERLKQRT